SALPEPLFPAYLRKTSWKLPPKILRIPFGNFIGNSSGSPPDAFALYSGYNLISFATQFIANETSVFLTLLAELPAPSTPQPSALDIFQSIQALGKKFDALPQTSGDRAEALHKQMKSRVNALDQCWRMRSSVNAVSLGHMGNAIHAFNRTGKLPAFDPPAGQSLGHPYGQLHSSCLPHVGKQDFCEVELAPHSVVDGWLEQAMEGPLGVGKAELWYGMVHKQSETGGTDSRVIRCRLKSCLPTTYSVITHPGPTNHAGFATYKTRVILDLSLACVLTANAREFPWALLWVCSHSATDVLTCFSELIWTFMRWPSWQSGAIDMGVIFSNTKDEAWSQYKHLHGLGNLKNAIIDVNSQGR
ncbi:hypothetical protein BDR07DRAFT_1381544, partial [Suillus spraguei]